MKAVAVVYVLDGGKYSGYIIAGKEWIGNLSSFCRISITVRIADFTFKSSLKTKLFKMNSWLKVFMIYNVTSWMHLEELVSSLYAIFSVLHFISESDTKYQQGKQSTFLWSALWILCMSVKQHLSLSSSRLSSTGTFSRLISHKSWGLSENDLSEPHGHLEKGNFKRVRSGTRHIHMLFFPRNALPCQTHKGAVIFTDKQSNDAF